MFDVIMQADERESHNRQIQSKNKELSQLSVKLDLTKVCDKCSST